MIFIFVFTIIIITVLLLIVLRLSSRKKGKGRSGSLRAKWYGIVLGRVDDESSLFELIERDDSDTLVVGCAGGAVLLGGIPLGEFGRTIAASGHSALLISDPFQAWYLQDVETCSWKGLQEWRKRITSVIECASAKRQQYKNVVLIGNCMGGTAAMLLADLPNVKRVVAFAPQTTLNKSKSWYWLNSLRVPRALRDSFEAMLEQNVSQCPHVAVYFSTKKDFDMAKVFVFDCLFHSSILMSL